MESANPLNVSETPEEHQLEAGTPTDKKELVEEEEYKPVSYFALFK
jgi:hypothetical protein